LYRPVKVVPARPGRKALHRARPTCDYGRCVQSAKALRTPRTKVDLLTINPIPWANTEHSLSQSDLEHIERLFYKNADDIALAIGRSFERLEERIDAAESRLYSRLVDIEDKLDSREDEQEVFDD